MKRSLPVYILVFIGLFGFAGVAVAAPFFSYQRSLLPIDSTENVGTSTAVWDEGWFNELCLAADCRTAWPSSGGSGSGTISTSTNPTIGDLAYWTSLSTIGSVATSTLKIALSDTTGVLAISRGGTASSTALAGILAGNGTSAIKSAIIGSGLAWDGSTLTATASGGTVTQIDTTYPLTGGPITTTGTLALDFGTTTSNTWAGTQTFTSAPIFSALTLGGLGVTGTGLVYKYATTTYSTGLTWANGNVTFDGGSSPGGSLGGTWASPTIDDLFLLNSADDTTTGSLTATHFISNSAVATSTFTNAIQMGATAGDNLFKATCGRVFPASSSVGGCFNVNNTLNSGPAMLLYSNWGATATGPLFHTRVDNAAFDFPGWRLDYDGTNDAMVIVTTSAASNVFSFSHAGTDHLANFTYTGTTANKGALNLSSTNDLGSPFQVTGDPDGLGVAKITHDGVGDADSSVLSLAASDTGYLGQGVFINIETVNATQKILNIRADSSEKMTLMADGKLGIGSTTPFSLLSVGSVFGVQSTGGFILNATQPATSTAITLDWSTTGPQVEYRIGEAATTISLINATSSTYWGSRKIIVVCNPGTTASTVSWNGVEWTGGAPPTHTTTASVCDTYSFFVTRATSTTAYKVFGAASQNFQ